MSTSLPHPVKSFLAGSISGACSTVLFQPLDLIKTRIQLKEKTQISSAMRISLIGTAVTVVKQDGVLGLWCGLVPSLVRTVPGIGIYFCSLHSIVKKCQSKDRPQPIESLVMAACARTVAGVCTLPFTVLKTRYESGFFDYKSVWRGLATIYHSEGYRGLYTGLGATLLRDVPFSALYFMFYTQSKSFVATRSDRAANEKPVVHFLCGVVAGCLASVSTHPADVVKTRLQIIRLQAGETRRVIKSIVNEDGIAGFFRGLVPRLLRRTLMAAMSWTVYEQLTLYLDVKI